MRLTACLTVLRNVLAAEYNCRPEDFDRSGVLVTERPDERTAWPADARRYALHHPALAMISFGRGTVVSASAELLPEAERTFAALGRDEAFDPPALAAADALLARHGYRLAGPYPRLFCAADTVRVRAAPAGVAIAVEEQPTNERLLALGGPDRWPNAVSRRAVAAGKVQAAIAVARVDLEVIGLASLGKDAPRLWQIGIDVAPAHQGRGTAAALVSTLAGYALERGAVPWYSLAPANIPSLRTALAAGFVPGWLETFTYGPALSA